MGLLSISIVVWANATDTQRLQRESTLSPRVLVLQASEDAHGSYNAMMNCIFSAHRSSIPVDACVLGAKDSSFLQQASFITGTFPHHCHENLNT